MPWDIQFNHTLHVIEVTLTGVTTARDLQELTTSAITLGAEKGTVKFIVDAEQTEFTGSFFDVYELPQKQYITDKAERSSCIAVIQPLSKRGQEIASFYETACLNRGWTARCFTKRKDAEDWLLVFPSP